jgi:hypothetical protein
VCFDPVLSPEEGAKHPHIRQRICKWRQAVSGCHDLLDLRNLLWGKADASTSN